MNTEIFNATDEGVALSLSPDTAFALTEVLARVQDNSEQGGLQRLYDALADEGFDDGPYVISAKENPDYDPDDEDDIAHFLYLNARSE